MTALPGFRSGWKQFLKVKDVGQAEKKKETPHVNHAEMALVRR